MDQPAGFRLSHHWKGQTADHSSLLARVATTPFWVYIWGISTPAPLVVWLVLKA